MFFACFISGFFNFRCSARIVYGNLDPKLTRAIKSSARAKNPFGIGSETGEWELIRLLSHTVPLVFCSCCFSAMLKDMWITYKVEITCDDICMRTASDQTAGICSMTTAFKWFINTFITLTFLNVTALWLVVGAVAATAAITCSAPSSVASTTRFCTRRPPAPVAPVTPSCIGKKKKINQRVKVILREIRFCLELNLFSWI